ncbi:MAG: tRNA (5-methylaminomethyl-2-thiouridine)(34)-methyltransferase MnmD [Planctomycetes bacterium]|nr:tRNA (5-methylaminomethyl-2-thiouridine)(34)-methyltransferase MnmD [Planctomycetota bacterium]
MSHWLVEETSDGSRTLRSQRFAQCCHSSAGARAETLYVSLELSGVTARLRAGAATRVLEIGFGTGLGWLLSADEALSAGAALEFVALERDLLDAPTLRELGSAAHLRHPELEDALASWIEPTPSTGTARFEIAPRLALELYLGDARERVRELPRASFDACYLDPVSPDVNPELWTEEFLGDVVAALRPGAMLSSYCVQGAVRRRLQALGLQVEKRPGLGKKREVLVARKPVDSAT